ncbi:hypothetical protein PMAYCL1PPCAC_08499, partial [Pristionchus mayeri]
NLKEGRKYLEADSEGAKRVCSCSPSMRLEANNQCYHLNNGSVLCFDSSEKGNIYKERGKRAINADLSFVDAPFTFAGEKTNNLFVYSHVQKGKYVYTFYQCTPDKSTSLKFKKIGDISRQRRAHFAIQQPYFLSKNGKSIESFNGYRIDLGAMIAESDVFFCQSVYAEDESAIYMLSGDKLLIMMQNLDINVIDLCCCEKSRSTIAGILNGELLIYVHETLFSLKVSDVSITYYRQPTTSGTLPISQDRKKFHLHHHHLLHLLLPG